MTHREHWWKCSLRGDSWVRGCGVCWFVRANVLVIIAALIYFR